MGDYQTATSRWCRPLVLALVIAAYYGIQGHLEVEAAMVRQWFAEDAELLHVQDQASLTDGLLPDVQRSGRRFFGNWLDLAARQLA